jgi:aryl-alcohol dehydrogenase-like predicted oxidoreductase
MKYRQLGDTGITVSAVGFGNWTVSTGWWGIDDDDFARRLTRQAYDLGITFFDTADTYGNGKGETLLAEALGDVRDKIVIATKGGYDWYTHGNERRGQKEIPQDWSSAYIRKAVEGSLTRLRTDHIDVYQLHNTKMDALQRDDLFAELDRLKEEGKIGAMPMWSTRSTTCSSRIPAARSSPSRGIAASASSSVCPTPPECSRAATRRTRSSARMTTAGTAQRSGSKKASGSSTRCGF